MAEDGVAEANGGPGMERGDYQWDSVRQLTRIQSSPVFHALIPIPELSMCLQFFTLAATTFLHQTRRRHCK